MNEQAYIRPCSAFPDGLEFDRAYIPVLERKNLIVKDDYSENSGPLDYAAIYDPWDDEDTETVARAIERLVNTWR